MTPWLYNDRPAGFSLPDYALDAEAGQELTDRIWSALVTGHDDVDDFVECEAEDSPLTEEQLQEAFQLARQARLDQQAQWTPEETRTNLDRAFDELNGVGIVARQDFTCCGTCGAAEIADECDDSRRWRGYVFFHQQDTESLLDSGSVYLAYGVFTPEDFDQAVYDQLSDEDKTAIYLADLQDVIGKDAVPRLESHGLNVEWDGDHSTRILVHGAQWYTQLTP